MCERERGESGFKIRADGFASARRRPTERDDIAKTRFDPRSWAHRKRSSIICPKHSGSHSGRRPSNSGCSPRRTCQDPPFVCRNLSLHRARPAIDRRGCLQCRRDAVLLLYQVDPAFDTTPLAEAIADADEPTRLRFASVLGRMEATGAPAVLALIAAAEEASSQKIASAFGKALGGIGEPQQFHLSTPQQRFHLPNSRRAVGQSQRLDRSVNLLSALFAWA